MKLRKTVPMLLVAAALALSGCNKEATFSEKVDQGNLTVYVNDYFNEREKNQTVDVTTADIVAVGDNLIHSGLYKSGMNDSGVWNYDHLYQYVKEDIETADLACVNQETIYINDRNQLSGYPMFGTPPEIGDALVNAGFDVVTHATNHVMDRGEQGISDTLNFWKEKHPEMTVLGIHESQEEADKIQTVDVNGIRIAMLNYTYGTNGIPVPEDKPYLVDLFDPEEAAKDIKRAKEISDVVMVFGHVGTEYVYEPSEESKEWVDFFLEQGVDIAVDSHPHVTEPYKMLTREDGHQMLVYYSMGNFISTQDAVPRLIGGMAKFTIEKKTTGNESEITVKDYTMEPVVAHWNHNTGDYATYKFSDYTDELARKHGLYGITYDELSVANLNNIFNNIMSTEVTPAAGKLTVSSAAAAGAGQSDPADGSGETSESGT